MQHVRFEPWEGERYKQAPLGKRLLILGESHYDWTKGSSIDNDAAVTKDCIQEQLKGHYKKAFWTNIATTFVGHRPTLEEKREFWHSVAFYNYVQSSVGFGPRIPPSSEQLARSESAFFEVLESLQPQVVVALGYRLWPGLPEAASRTRSEDKGG
jgi:hypothetical protein